MATKYDECGPLTTLMYSNFCCCFVVVLLLFLNSVLAYQPFLVHFVLEENIGEAS